MNLASTIDSMGLALPYAVTRAAAGSYLNGLWTGGANSTIQVSGYLAPAQGEDLLRLPEGDRGRETLRFYAQQQLLTARASTAQKADVVAVPGKGTFEVAHVDDFGLTGGFWVAVIQRVEV